MMIAAKFLGLWNSFEEKKSSEKCDKVRKASDGNYISSSRCPLLSSVQSITTAVFFSLELEKTLPWTRQNGFSMPLVAYSRYFSRIPLSLFPSWPDDETAGLAWPGISRLPCKSSLKRSEFKTYDVPT